MPSFETLDRRAQGLRIVRSLARVVLSAILMVVIFALVPIPGRTGAVAFVKLVLGVAAFGAILAWQLRSVTKADHPRLRAGEALAVAFVLLVLGFAYTYMSLSNGNHASFSEHLDRIAAAYFSLTIITTVGFGDIVAKTDAARVVVCAQYILDLLFLFGVVRAYFGAAQLIVTRSAPGASPPPPPPPDH